MPKPFRKNFGRQPRFGDRRGGFRSGRGFGDRREGGFGDRRRDFRSLSGGQRSSLRNVLLERARAGVREAYTGKGASLVQAVRAIDDLDSAKSLLFSRLQEFFEINFPEFKLENIESYARLAKEFGSRNRLEVTLLSEAIGVSKAKQFMEDAKKSFGTDFSAEEESAVKALANALLVVCVERDALEKFVEAEAKRVLPNVTHLTDGLLAARLLSVAGGLDKLAGMPSSTIQVIGAENALFKHLRSHGRTPPPKHGIIFQSPLIRGAPLEQRGKIARALAAKIAIAAKADAYTGNFIAEKLKTDLEKRLKEIRR